MTKDLMQRPKPKAFDAWALLADLLADVDLDADPFEQCEQDTLDRPEPRQFPALDEGEEDNA